MGETQVTAYSIARFVVAGPALACAVEGLRRERKQAGRLERASGFGEQRTEVAEIDEDVGRDDEVAAMIRLGSEKGDDLRLGKTGVEALAPGDRQHAGRQVDTFHRLAKGGHLVGH